MAKILVVDDAKFMRAKIRKVLEQAGHEVVEAENGREAVEQYSRDKAELVLMDITMPEMDGIQAVQELRKIDAQVKISMLSAMGQQQMVMEAIKAGAKDFVLKPFKPDKVLGVVDKLLRKG